MPYILVTTSGSFNKHTYEVLMSVSGPVGILIDQLLHEVPQCD